MPGRACSEMSPRVTTVSPALGMQQRMRQWLLHCWELQSPLHSPQPQNQVQV